MKNNKKYAFTMAETLIVLVVLGIIALITLPNIYKKYQEAVKRLQIKKAMKIYDLAVTKMTIENDLKSSSALQEWASKDDCDNSVRYFKTTYRSKCTFRTSDGLWWNVDDMLRPVITFDKITDDNLDSIKAKAKDLSNTDAFVMVTSTDNSTGAFRVDDLEYEKEHPVYNSDKLVEKLYDYISNAIKACDILCRYKRGDFTTPCQSNVKESCSVTTTNSQGVSTTKVYDSDGKQVGTVTTNANGVTTKEVIKNEDGSTTTITYRADGTKQQETIEKYDASGKNGFRTDIVYYDDGKTIKTEGSQEKKDGQWGCGYYKKYSANGNLTQEVEILSSAGLVTTDGMWGFQLSNTTYAKSTTYYENGIKKEYYENLPNTKDNKNLYETSLTTYKYNTNGVLTDINYSDYHIWTDGRGGGDFVNTSYYENGSIKREYRYTDLGGTGYGGQTLVSDSMVRTDFYENGQPKAISTLTTLQGMFGNYHDTDFYNSSGQRIATVSYTRADESLPYNQNQNKKTEITWYDSSGKIIAKDVNEYTAENVTAEIVISDGVTYTSTRNNSDVGVTINNSNPINRAYRITYDSNGNEIIDNNPRRQANSIVFYDLNCGYGCALDKSNNTYDFGMMPKW